MDGRSFDRFARLFSAAGSRRDALRALLAAALVGAAPVATDANARKKGRGRGNGRGENTGRGNDKGRDNDKDAGKKQRGSNNERRGGKGKNRKTKTRSEALPANCCSTGACTPGAGKNLSKCCYVDADVANKTFKGANLGSANFSGADASGANFAGANAGKACFVDADLTGANINGSTNLSGAIVCRTTMPDGSSNDSGCSKTTRCCQTCIARGAACGAGIGGDCCDGSECVGGVCACPAGTAECSDGVCRECCVNGEQSDCDDGEICCGNVCRSGDCCATGDCQDRQCQTKSCQGNECQYTAVTGQPGPLCDTSCCSDGCCAEAGSCNAQDRCGCLPNCGGRSCGPNGCNGSCGPGCSGAAPMCTEAGQCVQCLTASDCTAPVNGTATCFQGICNKFCNNNVDRICGSGAGVCQECCNDDRQCESIGGPCVNGTCQCPNANETRCGMDCVNINREPYQCGGCGDSGEICESGTCDNGQCREPEPCGLFCNPQHDPDCEPEFCSGDKECSRAINGTCSCSPGMVDCDGDGFCEACGRCGVTPCPDDPETGDPGFCCPGGYCSCGGECCEGPDCWVTVLTDGEGSPIGEREQCDTTGGCVDCWGACCSACINGNCASSGPIRGGSSRR